MLNGVQEVIIVGAGGHAKVCIELLQAMGKSIAYCIGGEDSAEHCLGLPVLKGNQHLYHLRQRGYKRVFIAVGANALREELANIAIAEGYDIVNAISPQAIISPTARLGRGIAIMAGVVINADTVIEDLAIINTGVIIAHDCYIGRVAHIAPQSALAGNVRVGSHSFLGMGSRVIPRVNIGRNVTIGAGGVVIADVSDNITAVGVPARILKD